jgi:enoyl-CoA hydratase/carnithine racemase
MSEAALLFEKKGQTAWLTHNRPQAMNAFNLEMVSLYEEYLPQIAADDDIRVLVVTGSGRAFCTGADLKEVQASSELPPGEPDFLDRLCCNILDVIRDMPQPVIASLNGATMAGGLELAMCADLIVAAKGVQIADAHANYGVFPGGGGAAILPRLIPLNVAKYLLFTGRPVPAEDLQRFGLVNEIVDADQLQSATQELADELALKSPLALARMKEVANASMDKSRRAALDHEQVLLRKHARSADVQEGLDAFVEKRPPQFPGR